MGYVNCESVKEGARIRLFEKKLSLFKEVAIFSLIQSFLKLGFIEIGKYCILSRFMA